MPGPIAAQFSTTTQYHPAVRFVHHALEVDAGAVAIAVAGAVKRCVFHVQANTTKHA
jgi:hypothetical protein